MQPPPFIPGQRRFVLGLNASQVGKPFRFRLPYPVVSPAMPPPEDFEPALLPKFKAISPFERSESYIQDVLNQGDHHNTAEQLEDDRDSVPPRWPTQDNWGRKPRSVSTPKQESTKQKQPQNIPRPAPSTPSGTSGTSKPQPNARSSSSTPSNPSGGGSAKSSGTKSAPSSKACTDPFARHSRKVINGDFSSVWFCSRANDLFYHVISPTGEAQLWLWSGSAWSSVSVGAVREVNNREYILHIFPGRGHPGWVTKEVYDRHSREL
ncbi:hypothetical protein AB1N83_011720 [Pleurotus pulmonarius]